MGCDIELTKTINNYLSLYRISSDSKLFGTGGQLAQCKFCGTVQKPLDAAWLAECEAIYNSYDSYSGSGGVEQSVRGGALTNDRFAPRSDLALEALLSRGALSSNGRLLDYGCGRGPTTRAASRLLPGWRVDGYDLDRRAEAELNNMENFDTLFSGSPKETLDQMIASGALYDLIALVHVLEHIPRGHETLSKLSQLLAPGGQILVQVPNRISNPFDLLIADHTVHFDSLSLFRVVQRSGLSVHMLSEDCIAKELTVLAGYGKEIPQPVSMQISAALQVTWLEQVGKLCRNTASLGSWGIFGTSNVASWIKGEAGGGPDFYIDEDGAKQGQKIDGVDILRLEQAPSGANVLMAMAPIVAENIMSRLITLPLNFIVLPAVPDCQT